MKTDSPPRTGDDPPPLEGGLIREQARRSLESDEPLFTVREVKSSRVLVLTQAAGGGRPAPLAVWVLFVLVAVGLALLAIRRSRGRDDDDGQGRGPGGGGPRRPGPKEPDSPCGEPVCWPEFERQFAGYIATQKAKVR